MTIVVARDGVIASDSGVQGGDTYLWDVPKILRTDGGFIGLAGEWPKAFEIAAKYAEGQEDIPGTADKRFEFIELLPGGKIQVSSDCRFWVEVSEQYAAIGSGLIVAYGALDMGASAEEAVRIAIKRDVDCLGELRSHKLPSARIRAI